jgi:para-nitrobenzyl esterase
MKRLISSLAMAGALAATLHAGIQEPIKVDGGLITGRPSWEWNVRAYRGIPFAAPPVGELRWKPPQPVLPWPGVRAADHFGASCMQAQREQSNSWWNDDVYPVSEDCLYLNVWTPAASASERLPVMVWIYGGAGVQGSGSEQFYDGDGLAKQGVVVVTFNYRVNVFGWMAHPELTKESPNHSSGNYGALDQVAALQWVQRNIAAFGGDPAKVMIFGQSGGSRSVNWLQASPLARGLFRAAAGESHAVFDAMTPLARAESQGVAFAQGIGKSSLAELRAMSAADLEAASIKSPSGMSGAIVDGWFLPQEVRAIFAAGRQNDVALLTGATNDETGAIVGPGGARSRGPAAMTVSSYTEWAHATFGARAEAFLDAYPAKTDAQVKTAMHDALRDANFAVHRTWARAQATSGKSPVYLYMFRQGPPAPPGNGNSQPPMIGAAHGAEIFYVFDNLRYRDLPWTAADRRIATMTSAYWSNFAKALDPNGPGLPAWPAYRSSAEQYLSIGDPTRVETIRASALDLFAEP